MYTSIEYWTELGAYAYILAFCGFCCLYSLVVLIYKCIAICSKEKVVKKDVEEGVSVIITANNRAEDLKENLEYYLKQDYPDFEVIVVDECSEDNTQEVLAEMQQQYPNLRTTRIFSDTKFRNTKKLAINIGILAAQHDLLLFSEINCHPASLHWIRTIQSYCDKNTSVVLSYANYIVGDEQISIRRLFRFFWFVKLFWLAKGGLYVTGDGRNMAYRKKFYMISKGFTKNSQSYMGYDNEMVTQLSKFGKVQVARNENAYVIINDKGKKTWMEDFTYYYQNKRNWPVWAMLKSGLDVSIRSFFYVLGLLLIWAEIMPEYVLGSILLMFLVDLIATNVYLRHLKQRKLFLTSIIVSIIGFVYRWYYNVYSIFTRKKWR